MKKYYKFHYAWVVLLCCCLIQAGTLGAISNCKGVFYDAVCVELNMPLGTFTLQGVFAGITSALMTPIALQILKRNTMNKVLFYASVLYTGTQVAMAFLGRQVLLWYLLAILQAVGGSFLLFLPVPIIINRWFVKKQGIAMAIAASFSGISGMLLNPVYAKIIELCGWRYGYCFSGILSFFLVGPILLIALRDSPEKISVKPYGWERGHCEGNINQESGEKLDYKGILLFLGLLVVAFCLSCGSCFQSHLTKYGLTLGFSLSESAFLPSAAMFGSVVWKPVLGLLVDKLDAYKATGIAFILNIFGFLAFLFSVFSKFCVYVGSFFCGISMAGNVVLFPLLAGRVLKGYNFEQYYAYLSMVISMTGVTCGALFGYIFDFTGTYQMVFYILIVMAMINFGAFWFLWLKEKHL